MIAPLRTVPGRSGDVVRASERPLGELLMEREQLHPDVVDAALESQRGLRQPLGSILVTRGQISAEAVARALAEQWGMGFADLDRDPPPADLIEPADLDAYLRHGILPWRRLGGIIVYAVIDPAHASLSLGALSDAPPFAFFATCEPAAFRRALARACGPALAERAATRTPDSVSARTLGHWRVAGLSLFFAAVLAIVIESIFLIVLIVTAIFLINTVTMFFRLAALLAGVRARHAEPEARRTGDAVIFADHQSLPKVSVLVPLFREAAVVPRLIRSLEALDYPRELLEVKLLLEAGDGETVERLSETPLPTWIEIIEVPPGSPQTKPRALNYALDFCTGEIVGILDAEDRPEPDQIHRIARHLRRAPIDVACVQCQLSYWNAKENWLTRCFQIEYAIWFDVLLGGYRALGLPIPLGGTSVYFRRSALELLGGWDAHNVTEDADLGMRLARRAMRCEVVRSTTWEEANCRLGSWIRQRSRWLKGYMMTWANHMRRPIRLLREMGLRGFLGFNMIFLGAATAYLAMPVFWFSSLEWLVTGSSVWHGLLPDWAMATAGASLVLGQGVMIATALIALTRRRALGLIGWVATLPFYWTLGAIAAWKAVIELIVAPYYWDKTRHGLTRMEDETPA